MTSESRFDQGGGALPAHENRCGYGIHAGVSAIGKIGLGFIGHEVHVPEFKSGIFIKDPAQTRKGSVLVETGEPAAGVIGNIVHVEEKLIPEDQAQPRLKLKGVNQLDQGSGADARCISPDKAHFDHFPQSDGAESGGENVTNCWPGILFTDITLAVIFGRKIGVTGPKGQSIGQSIAYGRPKHPLIEVHVLHRVCVIESALGFKPEPGRAQMVIHVGEIAFSDSLGPEPLRFRDPLAGRRRIQGWCNDRKKEGRQKNFECSESF